MVLVLGQGRDPSKQDYSFSICQYSSSSGVGRPKIVVMIRTIPLSGMTSSTSPSKFWNAPLVTLILSPFLNSGAASAPSGFSASSSILDWPLGLIGVGLP